MPAANTGVTGGSTRFGDDCDWDVVVVGTLRLRYLLLLDGGRQVLGFPGTTLDALETASKPLAATRVRVVLSRCLRRGGVCNNCGGSLIRRDPA